MFSDTSFCLQNVIFQCKMTSIIWQSKMLPNISASSVMQDKPACCQYWLINPPTRDNCYIVTNYNRPWPYTLTHAASIACGYLIASHNHSCVITNTNVWSFQWADHELIWWTNWHEHFFIISVINKHQNDQWLQCVTQTTGISGTWHSNIHVYPTNHIIM